MKRLTNRQMSSIVGGDLWYCTYVPVHPVPTPPPTSDGYGTIGPSIIVEAGSAQEAANKVHAMTGATQVNCTRN